MIKNRRVVREFQYTVPSPSSYPYQWFWDSCFHAIILSHFDTESAKKELRSLVANQHENGMIGHVTYWEKHHTVLNIGWGFEHTSSLIQPPLLAYALWRVYDRTRDGDFLAEIYEPTRKFYNYLVSERDVRNVGLVGLVNPDESGEDNSPRFDGELELPPYHPVETNQKRRFALFDMHKDCKYAAVCTSKFFWVEDVPVNAFMVWNLDIMSDIARILGRKEDAKTFKAHEWRMRAAMRTHMFDAGLFKSLTGMNGMKLEEKTLARFIPLVANLYTQEEAAHLVAWDLTDERTYWLPFGVPSVAQDDPAFDANEPTWGEAWQHPHWRGPIWMAMNWFMFHGLNRYGFHTEAEEIRKKSLALVEKSGFREYYNPLTGDGQGAQDFTWGGLILDMA